MAIAGMTLVACNVSIHAPREGCDVTTSSIIAEEVMFQFTHPGRGATMMSIGSLARSSVSIHAPREGCDERDA